jgi:hypothetical protein
MSEQWAELVKKRLRIFQEWCENRGDAPACKFGRRGKTDVAPWRASNTPHSSPLSLCRNARRVC